MFSTTVILQVYDLFEQIAVIVVLPALRAVTLPFWVIFATLGFASEVIVQTDKTGIVDDAVSAVIHDAVVYMPFAELVDIAKEIERLEKEKTRLEGELKRVNGMLANPNFVNKAPEAKLNEEKEKLAKYTSMYEQVNERLAALK